MNMIRLIALREYAENVKTKGFWAGILLFPILLVGVFFFQTMLAESTPTRHYFLIDQSGKYAEAVDAAIRQEEQRRILQAFVTYVLENRKEPNLEQTPGNATAQIDQLIDDVGTDEVAALDQWLESGGLNFALTLAAPYLKEGAAPFEAPREQFVRAPLPENIDSQASPEALIEQLRPWLTGERLLRSEEGSSPLFALILIPADVDSSIARPGMGTAPQTGVRGIQYWASNLTDTRLPNAIERK